MSSETHQYALQSCPESSQNNFNPEKGMSVLGALKLPVAFLICFGDVQGSKRKIKKQFKNTMTNITA